jgi:hypothetical protein
MRRGAVGRRGGSREGGRGGGDERVYMERRGYSGEQQGGIL